MILADSAYPCLRNLLTPYKDRGNLNNIEKNFNFKLSHCRILIEHCFGILKQKFRQLYHVKLKSEELICHFIRACCVLHNLTIDIGLDDEIPNEIIDEIPVENNQIENNIAGQAYRNYVATLLYN